MIFSVIGGILLSVMGIVLYKVGYEAGKQATREDWDEEGKIYGDGKDRL